MSKRVNGVAAKRPSCCISLSPSTHQPIYPSTFFQYELREVEGVSIRIATPETLFKMKKDTVRPEDKRDAWFLAELIAKKSSEKK